MPSHRAELKLSIQTGEGVMSLPASRAQLRRWVLAGLSGEAQLTLRFVSTDEGRELNRSFRGRDYATNVLTFPYDEAERVVADIVICVPVVEREAREQHKTVAQHLAHLIIHGVLHAQGFDHEDDDQAAAMEQRERQLLTRFGIPDPYADADGDGMMEH